jgi:Flp pilus assembly protein TadG
MIQLNRRHRVARRRHRLGTARHAVAALEFAIVAPVFVILLVGVVDLSRALWLTMRLETAVAAATNYALVNEAWANTATTATAPNVTTLATNVAQIMGANLGTTLTSGSVIVNNGITALVTAGTVSTGGSANLAACYCPSGTTSPWTWGTAVTCGSACATSGGAAAGYAGQFVAIHTTQTFVPIFSSYNLIPNNQISANAMVEINEPAT